MNVLHLNKHEATGGAAVAAKRLHTGLLDSDINSRMLVERTATADSAISSRSRLPNGVSSIARFVLDKLIARKKVGFTTGLIPSRVHQQLNEEQLDLVHLHWLGDGFLGIRDIGQIELPLVWTLHDMWPVTGGCHYAGDCSRYEDNCGNCPVLESSSSTDLSSQIHAWKSRQWSDSEMHFVAPSRWMAECVRSASLTGDTDVTVIPNGLDTELYHPNPSGTVIESDRTTILFGAISATSDPRKGYDLLTTALADLSNPSEYTCIVFGDDDPELNDVEVETESYGYLSEPDLIRLYADCDVMVVPSRQESFGQTAMEALACGTPVVAFNATGPRDIVTAEETGYLAEPYDPVDLRAGIEWVTESTARREKLGRAARKDAVERFDIQKVVDQYTTLYKQVAES